MVPVVDAPMAFTSESLALSPGSPISVPTGIPKQLGSTGDQGLETLPTVSDLAMLMIVVSN